MKKTLCRILVLTLTICLLCSSAHGADLVFIAVDDSIPLTLPGSAAPFYSRGLLYVPYTAFGSSALSVFSSYNPDSNTVVLFSRTKRLTFAIKEGTMTDENGNVTEVITFTRGGVVFLPAGYCATHFSFRVATLTSLGGYPILRFTTNDSVYDDRTFVQQAENLIAYRVSQYQAEQTPDTSSPGPSDPPEQPGANEPPDEPEPDPITVYLAITGADTGAQALASVQQAGLPAVFFFTRQEIEENGPLIRQLQAAGCSIGITVAADWQDVTAELEQANQALELVCKNRTLLALLPQDAEARPAGYRIIEAPTARVSATQIANSARRYHLLLCTAENLEPALAILSGDNITFDLLRETSPLEG